MALPVTDPNDLKELSQGGVPVSDPKDIAELNAAPPSDGGMSTAQIASKQYTPALWAGGSMLGGALAGGESGSVLGPWGTLGGAVLGGAAGLAASHGADVLSGASNPDRSIGDVVGATRDALNESMQGEALGGAIGKVGEGLYKELSPEAKQMWDYAKARGINLSLDQISNNATVKFLGSAFRALPFSKSVAEASDAKTLSSLINELNDLLQTGGATDAVKEKGMQIKQFLGDAIFKNTNEIGVQQENLANELLSRHGSPFNYNELSMGEQAQQAKYSKLINEQAKKIWDSAPVDMKGTQATYHDQVGEKANQLLEEMAPYATQPGSNGLIANLQKASGADIKQAFIQDAQQKISNAYGSFSANFGADINPSIKKQIDSGLMDQFGIDVNNIDKSPALQDMLKNRTLSLDQLQEMRSTALQIQRQTNPSSGFANGPVSGFSTTLSKRWGEYADSLKDAVNNGLQKTGGDDAVQWYETARAYSSFKANEINRDTFTNILNQQNPERIYPMLVQPGNITPIMDVKRAWGTESPAWQNYQDRWMREAFDTDNLTPEYLEKLNDKWGKSTIDQILSPKAAADWYQLPDQLRSIGISSSAGSRLAENQVFQKIINSESGTSVIHTIVGNSLTNGQRFQRIQELSKALDSVGQDGKKLVGQAVLADILKPNSQGLPSGNAMNRMRLAYGDDFVNYLFSKDQIEKLDNYVNTIHTITGNVSSLSNSSRTAPSGFAGRMLMKIMMNPVTTGTLGAGSWALAKGFYSKTFTDAVMEGFMHDPEAKKWATQLPKLMGILTGGGNSEDQ